MEISKTILPKSRLKFEVKLSELEVAEFFQIAYQQLAASVHVDGFRPGKAPEAVTKQKIGEVNLREEAFSRAVKAAWQQVVEQKIPAPIEDPKVEIVKFFENQAGEICFEFDIKPAIKIGNWQKIKIKPIKDEKVSPAEVDQLLESLTKAHATTIAKLSPAQKGDKVEIDFEGSLKGIKKDSLSSKNFPLIIGEKMAIPGFEDHLLGLKKGESKTFTVEFPKDHFDKELAGEKVEFTAKVNEIFEVILPKTDDELAKKFGHDTFSQLTKAIEKDLAKKKQQDILTQKKADWLSQFEKLIEVDLPECLIKTEIERSKKAWLDFLASRNISPNSWLERQKLTMDKLETDWRAAAQSSVKIGLGLAEIATKQDRILGSNEEFQEFLNEVVAKAIGSNQEKKK